MSNWIRWWEYKSFLKLIGVAIGAVVICLLCALFIPTPWCLIPIAIIAIAGRLLIKKVFPDVVDDLAGIFGIDDEEKEKETE